MSDLLFCLNLHDPVIQRTISKHFSTEEKLIFFINMILSEMDNNIYNFVSVLDKFSRNINYTQFYKLNLNILDEQDKKNLDYTLLTICDQIYRIYVELKKENLVSDDGNVCFVLYKIKNCFVFLKLII